MSKNDEAGKKEHQVAFRVFRDDMAKYLGLLANGEEITIFNAKRNIPIVTLKSTVESR